MLVLSSALAFVRPASPAQLHDYLLGDWALEKRMRYERGGLSGTFAGGAAFSPLVHESRPLLLGFAEHGHAVLDGRQRFEARQRLLWDCGSRSDELVHVSFDTAPGGDSRTVEAILDGARPFHTVRLGGAAVTPPFSHPCARDLYTGRLCFESADRFELHWQVDGPTKSGEVRSTFVRRADPRRRRGAVRACATGGGSDDERADGPDEGEGLTIGDLLAEVAARQARELPPGALLEVMESSIDALLEGGAAELDEAAAILSAELEFVGSNMSAALERKLGEAEVQALRRLQATTRALQDGMITPARAAIAGELDTLNRTTSEYEALKAEDTGRLGSRPRRGRGPQAAPLPSGASSALVRACEVSASALGLLFFLAALGAVGGLEGLVGGDAYRSLVLGWRAALGASLAVYAAALLRLLGAQRGDAVAEPEPGDPIDPRPRDDASG